MSCFDHSFSFKGSLSHTLGLFLSPTYDLDSLLGEVRARTMGLVANLDSKLAEWDTVKHLANKGV